MPAIHLRLTQEQHAELTQDAKVAGRSLQRELEWRVFQHYRVTRAMDPTAPPRPMVSPEPATPGPPPRALPEFKADPKDKASQEHAPREKRKSAGGMCEHRVPIGSFCKRCEEEAA